MTGGNAVMVDDVGTTTTAHGLGGGGGGLSQGGQGQGLGLGSGPGLIGGGGGGGMLLQECVHGWAVAALAAAGTAVIGEDREKTKNMGGQRPTAAAGNNSTDNSNDNNNDNMNIIIPGFNGVPGTLDRDGKIKLLVAVSEDPSFLGLMQGIRITTLSYPITYYLTRARTHI